MKHGEDNLQMNCVKWMDYAYPNLSIHLHHSPNGAFYGYANRFKAGLKFKKLGVRKGFPDLFLSIPSKGFHGLFIEMKYGKGRLTEHQKIYLSALKNQGYQVDVCYSFDEFMGIINTYLKK